MRILLFLILIVTTQTAFSQISGNVTDDNNNSLSFVNIYIEGTSTGTTSNIEGKYVLNTPKGNINLVFQYIGYKTATVSVEVGDDPITLNQTLTIESYNLEEITINADAEDPAYAIIRKAQSKRSYYRNLMDNFTCDAYMKGFNEIYESPSKILGFDLDELEETLDDGKGVIYLSESVSKVYKKGSKAKEVMLSSIVSGNDQGYSFNSAKEMDHNFYDNTVELNKSLISPIARNALTYYDYKLEGTIYEGNQLVNKIKVIPKNEYSNTFYGYIFINEDLWNIHSLELGVTKHSTQLPFLDSLTMKHIYLPLEGDRWMLLSNVINFKMSALGFKIGGNFAAVFSDYNLGTVSDDDFSNEVFKVEEEANDRTQEYWNSIRPIPLTETEAIDYHRKDSIRIVHESPAYLDSIDRIQNEFKVLNILNGYSHRNSLSRTSWATKPNLGLNTIQGWNVGIDLDWTKHYAKDRAKRLNVATNVNYGFSDEDIRAEARINYRANRTNYARYYIEGGKRFTQFSRLNPISKRLNSIFTLLLDDNFLKAYDKTFIELGHSRYLADAIRGGISVAYESRTALVNNFDTDDLDFTSNNPQDPSNDAVAFDPHRALLLRAHILLHPGQKIWSYPNRVFREAGRWPVIGFYYKGGLPIDNNQADYNLVYTTISKTIDGGSYGTTRLYGMAGTFLGESPQQFIDYFHFLGTQTHIANTSQYSRRFLMLPYYDMSSADDFAQVHLEHNFSGFLLSKVPILKRTQWQFVLGYKLLSTSDQGDYDEITLGLDNFGFKLFRLFRIDAVFHRRYAHPENLGPTDRRFGVIVGLKIDLF